VVETKPLNDETLLALLRKFQREEGENDPWNSRGHYC
jgi:3-dehydroquinate synthase